MMMKLRIPSWASVSLALLAGLLATLNLTTFHLGAPWTTLVTTGLAALAGMGIAPLTGPALDNALHISYPTALAISSAFATGAVALTTVNMDHTVRSILVGILTACAGMLAGPAGPGHVPPAPPPPPA